MSQSAGGDVDVLLAELSKDPGEAKGLYSSLQALLQASRPKSPSKSGGTRTPPSAAGFLSGNPRTDAARTGKLLTLVSRDVLTAPARPTADDPGGYALRALGELVHASKTVPYFTADLVSTFVETITHGLRSDRNKSVTSLSAWCVSVNNLAADLLQPHLAEILRALTFALEASAFKASTSLVAEILCAFTKLLTRLNTAMKTKENIVLWMPALFERMLHSDKANREKAQTLVNSVLHTLRPPPEALSEALFERMKPNANEPKQPCLLTSINDLMKQHAPNPAAGGETTSVSLTSAVVVTDEASIEWVLAVVNAWGPLVYFLGPKLLQQNLINAMLKIPEQTFLHAEPRIRLATLQAWQNLADNFSFQKDGILLPKRLNLMMIPLNNCLQTDTDPEIRQEALDLCKYLLDMMVEADGCASDALWVVAFHRTLLDSVLGPVLSTEPTNPLTTTFLHTLTSEISKPKLDGNRGLVISPLESKPTNSKTPDPKYHRLSLLLNDVILRVVQSEAFFSNSNDVSTWTEKLFGSIVGRLVENIGAIPKAPTTKPSTHGPGNSKLSGRQLVPVVEAREHLQVLVEFIHQLALLPAGDLFAATSAGPVQGLEAMPRVSFLLKCVSLIVEQFGNLVFPIDAGQTNVADPTGGRNVLLLFDLNANIRIGGGRSTNPLGALFARSFLQLIWTRSQIGGSPAPSASASSQPKPTLASGILSAAKLDLLLREAVASLLKSFTGPLYIIRGVDILLAELWNHIKDNLLNSDPKAGTKQFLVTLTQTLFANSADTSQIMPKSNAKQQMQDSMQSSAKAMVGAYLSLWRGICDTFKSVVTEHQVITERAEMAGAIFAEPRPTSGVTFADESLSQASTTSTPSSPLNSWLFYIATTPSSSSTDTSDTMDEKITAVEKFLKDLTKDPQEDSIEDSTAVLALDSISKRPFHVFFKALLWPVRLATELSCMWLETHTNGDIPASTQGSLLTSLFPAETGQTSSPGPSLVSDVFQASSTGMKSLLDVFFTTAQLKKYVVNRSTGTDDPLPSSAPTSPKKRGAGATAKGDRQSSVDLPAVSTPLSIASELVACLRLMTRVCLAHQSGLVEKFVGAPRYGHSQQLAASSWLKLVLPWLVSVLRGTVGEMTLQAGQSRAGRADQMDVDLAESGGAVPNGFWGYPAAIKVPWNWTVPISTHVPSATPAPPVGKSPAKGKAPKGHTMLFADSNDDDTQQQALPTKVAPNHDVGAAILAALPSAARLSEFYRIANFINELVDITAWSMDKLSGLHGGPDTGDFAGGSSASRSQPTTVSGGIGDDQLIHVLELIRSLCAILPNYGPSTPGALAIEATVADPKLAKSAKNSPPTATITTGNAVWHAFYHAIEPTFDTCLASSKFQTLGLGVKSEIAQRSMPVLGDQFKRSQEGAEGTGREKSLLLPPVVLSSNARHVLDNVWELLINKYSQSHGVANYESSGLHNLSPFLQTGFSCKHRYIKNATLTFWNTTFVANASTASKAKGKTPSGQTDPAALVYPPELVILFATLREKIQADELPLPGHFEKQYANNPAAEMPAGPSSTKNFATPKGKLATVKQDKPAGKAPYQPPQDHSILDASLRGDESEHHHAVPTDKKVMAKFKESITHLKGEDASDEDSMEVEPTAPRPPTASNSKSQTPSATPGKSSSSPTKKSYPSTEEASSAANNPRLLTERQKEARKQQNRANQLGGVRTYTDVDASIAPPASQSLSYEMDKDGEELEGPSEEEIARARASAVKSRKRPYSEVKEDETEDEETPLPASSAKRRKTTAEPTVVIPTVVAAQLGHWQAALETLCGSPDLSKILEHMPRDVLIRSQTRLLALVTQKSGRLAKDLK